MSLAPGMVRLSLTRSLCCTLAVCRTNFSFVERTYEIMFVISNRVNKWFSILQKKKGLMFSTYQCLFDFVLRLRFTNDKKWSLSFGTPYTFLHLPYHTSLKNKTPVVSWFKCKTWIITVFVSCFFFFLPTRKQNGSSPCTQDGSKLGLATSVWKFTFIVHPCLCTWKCEYMCLCVCVCRWSYKT